MDSGAFGQIYIAIESEDLLRSVPALANWLQGGIIRIAPCGKTLADSVIDAVQMLDIPFPLVISTGDNAVHTPQLLQDFAAQFARSTADVAVAFTTAETVIKDYPEVGLAYHWLKDGGFSSCNLYGLRTPQSLKSAMVFKSGGQFGKRQWRIFKTFGLVPFIWYKLRLVSLQKLMQRIARNLGLSADVIMLPYAYGPIDVDNIAFFEVSEKILHQRRLAGKKSDELPDPGPKK